MLIETLKYTQVSGTFNLKHNQKNKLIHWSFKKLDLIGSVFF